MLTWIPSLISLLFLFFPPREQNHGQEVAAMFSFAEGLEVGCFKDDPIGVTRTCWHFYSKATQTWNHHLLPKAFILISSSPVLTKDICSNILPLIHGSLLMTLIPVRRTNVRSRAFYICVNSSTVNKLSKNFICSKNYPYVYNEFHYHSQSYKLSKWKICWILFHLKFLFTFLSGSVPSTHIIPC